MMTGTILVIFEGDDGGDIFGRMIGEINLSA